MIDKGYRVLIPDCVIRNEDGINISPKEFVLYYYLKILYDRQKNTKIKLNHNKFMAKFNIKTNTTFKKLVSGLHENKLIMNNIDKLPKHENIIIELNEEILQRKPFTMIHINLYHLYEKVECEGLRLIYYYESRVNRSKQICSQFCFAGIRTIAQETKINKNKLKGINEKLVKLKLLKMEKHEMGGIGMYNEFNQEINIKYNNHYFPLIQNIKDWEYKNKNGGDC